MAWGISRLLQLAKHFRFNRTALSDGDEFERLFFAPISERGFIRVEVKIPFTGAAINMSRLERLSGTAG
jgi:hypothetical protein